MNTTPSKAIVPSCVNVEITTHQVALMPVDYMASWFTFENTYSIIFVKRKEWSINAHESFGITDLKNFTDRSVMEGKSGSRGTFLKKRSSQQMMPMTSGEKPSERLFFQRRICAYLPLEDAAILAKACESHTCLSSWGFNSPNVSTSA